MALSNSELRPRADGRRSEHRRIAPRSSSAARYSHDGQIGSRGARRCERRQPSLSKPVDAQWLCARVRRAIRGGWWTNVPRRTISHVGLDAWLLRVLVWIHIVMVGDCSHRNDRIARTGTFAAYGDTAAAISDRIRSRHDSRFWWPREGEHPSDGGGAPGRCLVSGAASIMGSRTL